VALYVVEFTFSRGFDSFCESEATLEVVGNTGKLSSEKAKTPGVMGIGFFFGTFGDLGYTPQH
jgi:hypothetical protein